MPGSDHTSHDGSHDDSHRNDVELVRSWIDDSNRIVVLTGAGISTDSGIRDFRGPNGIWTKNPAAEKAATLEHYMNEPQTRRTTWRNRL
ncbi:MAG TPA: Sir2 family NAD-dependent protein deacetylase, partial [Acidimicrobiales bacterium]